MDGLENGRCVFIPKGAGMEMLCGDQIPLPDPPWELMDYLACGVIVIGVIVLVHIGKYLVGLMEQAIENSVIKKENSVIKKERLR